MKNPFSKEKPPEDFSRIVTHKIGIDDFKTEVLGPVPYDHMTIQKYNFKKIPEFDTVLVHQCSDSSFEKVEDVREAFSKEISHLIDLFNPKKIIIHGILLPGTLTTLSNNFPRVKFGYMPVFTFSNKGDEFFVTPANGLTHEDLRDIYPNLNTTFFNKDARLLEVIALLLEYQVAVDCASRIESVNFFETSIIFRKVSKELMKYLAEDITNQDDFNDLRVHTKYLTNIAGLMKLQSRRKIATDVYEVLENAGKQ